MTTVAEAAELLALASAYDSRKPDEARIHAWHDALSDVDADDCAQFIRDHYRESREFLAPSDVRHGSFRVRHRRIASQRPPAQHWRQLQPAEPVPMPAYVREKLNQLSSRRQCEHGCLEKHDHDVAAS